MERAFDRAFNRAHGTVEDAIGSALARPDPKQEQKSREVQMRALTTPMTVEDVVERIDIAFRDGDYYRCAASTVLLQLLLLLLLYSTPVAFTCDALPCHALQHLNPVRNVCLLPMSRHPLNPFHACSPLLLVLQTYHRLLQLPGPQLNSLSKAEWAVSSSELSKAYRKLSVLVHPDKMPGEKARQAFEQLKQAYNELRDPEKLVSSCCTDAARAMYFDIPVLTPRAGSH
jgi:hypothetical protein